MGSSRLVYHSTPTLRSGGKLGDAKTSLVYDHRSGAVTVDVPSVEGEGVLGLFSRDHLFGAVPEQEFPIESDHAFFMQIPSAGEFPLATLLPPQLDQQALLEDLSVVTDGIGAVDLVYVPEPNCILLLMFALIGCACCFRLRRSSALLPSVAI